MVRFYCTICKRVKRVRVYPPSVSVFGDDVRSREGVCKWHVVRRGQSDMTISDKARMLASKGGR